MVKSDMLKFLKWFCEVSISLKKDTAMTAKTLLKMSSTIKALATGTIAETIDCKFLQMSVLLEHGRVRRQSRKEHIRNTISKFSGLLFDKSLEELTKLI